MLDQPVLIILYNKAQNADENKDKKHCLAHHAEAELRAGLRVQTEIVRPSARGHRRLRHCSEFDRILHQRRRNLCTKHDVNLTAHTKINEKKFTHLVIHRLEPLVLDPPRRVV